MRRTLCAALILLASPLAPAASETNSSPTLPLQSLDQTAIALADSAKNLAPADRVQTTRAALSIVLLSRFSRLLPAEIDSSKLEELARVFLVQKPDLARQNAMASRLSPADTLVFNGSQLLGGNFRHIDSLIGMDARPIALDRDLPIWIVPLTPASASALEDQQKKYQATQASAAIVDLANRIYLADIGGNLAADGIFLRPYAGRIDDLYHHLAQQGNDSSGLDFPALLDSLPPRQYSPISGTASRVSVPPSRYNLSDVLTAGSFYAIQKFRSENPKVNVKNPFKGLAARIVPFLGKSLRKTDVGSPLRVSGDILRRAISDPRRYTPEKVPPLFHDPSRFLGQWADPRYHRVSKKKKKSSASEILDEIQRIDFETPLPEMNLNPAGNELLGSDNPTEILELPEDETADSAADLMRDLGLPEEEPTPRPYTRPSAQPTPTPPIFTENFKPAPPSLEAETNPSQNLPPIEIALATPQPTPAPTPAPTPQPTPQPTPPAVVEPAPVLVSQPTPSPKPPAPSAVVTVQPKDQIPEVAPTASPTPAPQETIKVAKAIAVEPPTDSAEPNLSEPPAETSTSPSSTNRYQVAVLAPTTTEAVDYLKTIAASDVALADNMAEFNRTECYIRWIGEAVKPLAPEFARNPESEESQKLEETISQALQEVIALKTRRDELKVSRLKELEARHAARAALEKEIQTTRRDALARLTGVGA